MTVYHENQVPWPTGKPFCAARKRGPFRVSIATACDRVETAVRAFSCRTGQPWRTRELWIYIDGAALGARSRFLSNQRPLSPAVAVRFDLDGRVYNIAADRYTEAEQNLAGIAAYIDSVRAQERNGIFTVEEMLHTFAALPQTAGAGRRPWYDVLGVAMNAPISVAEAAFKIAARDAHPDVGGDREEWDELLSAIEEARNAHAGGSR